jgi:hypothetical protein
MLPSGEEQRLRGGAVGREWAWPMGTTRQRRRGRSGSTAKIFTTRWPIIARRVFLGLRSARRWSGWRSAWHHRSIRRPHRTGRLDRGLTGAQDVVTARTSQRSAVEVRGIRLVVQATLAETPLLSAKGSRFSLTAPRTIGFIEKRLTICG